MYNDADFDSMAMCCSCGGGSTGGGSGGGGASSPPSPPPPTKCLTFVEESTCDESQPMIVIGKWDIDKCYATSPSSGASRINLGWCDGDVHIGSMIHEIGHVLGLGHEAWYEA